MSTTEAGPAAAVLVGIRLPGTSEGECAASLAELERLVQTLGHPTLAKLVQPRPSHKGAAVLGDGKLRELARWTGGTGVVAERARRKPTKAELRRRSEDEDAEDAEDDGQSEDAPEDRARLVIFDCELSPSQMRNLESATGAEVLDRPAVIIQIFGRHARTRAAKLQVELAQLAYLAPRLRETGGGGGDRARGGIGGRGVGESRVELDRRRIRDRVKELGDQLDALAGEDGRRRDRRAEEHTVALVGYTNAGKSSMMRALTGSPVLVEDKLFATLDTTVRPLVPEAVPRVLVSDTVGFIRRLPHALVASFRSTLEEARGAALLVVVADASDPEFRLHLQVVAETLDSVGAGAVPRLLALNKADRLDRAVRAALAAEFPEAVCLSVLEPADVAQLRDRIVRHFEAGMVEAGLFVPFTVQGAIGRLRAAMRVLGEEHGAEGVTFRVRTRPETLARLATLLGPDVALVAATP